MNRERAHTIGLPSLRHYTSHGKTIADKRITRHHSITDYESALAKAGFKTKVAEWAKATSAGLSYYTLTVFGYDQVNKINRKAKTWASFSLYSQLTLSLGISSPDSSCDPLRKNRQDCDGKAQSEWQQF